MHPLRAIGAFILVWFWSVVFCIMFHRAGGSEEFVALIPAIGAFLMAL